MDEQAFLKNLEELLEMDRGSLKTDTAVTDLRQWDSLAFVSFLAMADSEYGIKVTPLSLRHCKTVGDLMQLVHKN